jgi:hypothetical protein
MHRTAQFISFNSSKTTPNPLGRKDGKKDLFFSRPILRWIQANSTKIQLDGNPTQALQHLFD